MGHIFIHAFFIQNQISDFIHDAAKIDYYSECYINVFLIYISLFLQFSYQNYSVFNPWFSAKVHDACPQLWLETDIFS